MLRHLFRLERALHTKFTTRASILLRPVSWFSSQYVNHRDTEDNNDHLPFEFTADNYKEIDKILARYPSNYKKSAVIPLLTIAQKQNDNFLTLAAMRKVAKVLEIPDIDVFEVASFYSMFNRTRLGKYHLQICGTTPCMLRGAPDIIAACEKHLKIHNGETTSDGLFTIQEVECLGACVNAPMLQINGEHVYEDLTPENVITLLQQLAQGKEAKLGPQIERNFCEGPQGRTTLKGLPEEIRHDRDFAKAKQDWQAAKDAAAAAAKAKAAAAPGK